jgi:hypothetical protein
MSYGLAVWEGQRPADDAEARTAFLAVKKLHQGPESTPAAPTPAVRRYVEALLEKWPDITEHGGEESPWADGPLIDNASGPLFHFALTSSEAEDVAAFCAELAVDFGLVFLDLQSGRMR